MGEISWWKFYNRKVLVDTFQVRLVAVGVFHFVLVVLIFASALFLPLVITLRSSDLSSPEVRQAAHEFLTLHNRLWLPLLGAFALLVLHNIIVSHRIAGPLYRFRKFLKSVGDGDLATRLSIRRGDYLHKEADAINEMLTGLRDKVSRLELQLDQTKDLWTNLRVSAADRVPDELEWKITTLGERLEECQAGVKSFRTKDTRTPSRRDKDEIPAEPVELKV